MVLWRLTRPSRTNGQKTCLFIIGDWNAKVGSQDIPWVNGKFGLGVQNEAGQRLTEFWQENALVIENTLSQHHDWTLHMDSPDGRYLNQIDYIIWSQRWRISADGESTGSKNKIGSWLSLRYELPTAKFKLKLKKVEKTTIPFSSVQFSSVQFSSVQFSSSVMSDSLQPHEPQQARTPCPSPVLRVHQTHVHWVGDAIQPSHPLLSPSPPALNLSPNQGLFQWVSSSHQVAKVLEFQPQHQSFQWTPRTELL